MSPEAGGPTTQSGILYQNSVAALYLGRLCDTTTRPKTLIVSHVRVEAPTDVDDIVITFADGHKTYIQAKENVSSGDSAWQKVWRDFDKQFQNDKFQREKDRLLFQIGTLHNDHDELKGLCQRANSENFEEWHDRLTERQKWLLDKIKDSLSPELLNHENLLEFISHVDIDIWPLDHIERDLIPHWMPQSNKSPFTLFRLFRDRVGGKSRVRGNFTAHQLRGSLESEEPDLQFALPLDTFISKIFNK